MTRMYDVLELAFLSLKGPMPKTLDHVIKNQSFITVIQLQENDKYYTLIDFTKSLKYVKTEQQYQLLTERLFYEMSEYNEDFWMDK